MSDSSLFELPDRLNLHHLFQQHLYLHRPYLLHLLL